ncbi:MAG: hypothetical protein QNL12_16365 [Acidimicrobiia bacterium]|nr:hypothetical protein [Acidimicrobiia bacterium]MDX2468886.1 hypothetical protein [Acidimicrobiia bacterium]
MSRHPLSAILVTLLLMSGCAGSDDTRIYLPDDITPPAGVIETTAPPRDAIDPAVAPGPLTEDGLGYLIHSYLPNHILAPERNGEVFCAYELYGWELKTDTATAWLWTLCEEHFVTFGDLSEVSAVSTPVTIHLSELPAGWIVSFAEQPGMGDLYEDSVRQMFPPEFADLALNGRRSRDLSAEVKEAARNHLG